MKTNDMMIETDRVSYEVVRSDRKTMAIQIKKDGLVVVRVPRYATAAAVERFVGEHQGWIEKHYRAVSERLRQKEAFRWEDGATLLLFGDPVRLTVKMEPAARKISASFQDGVLTVVTPRPDEDIIETIVKNWYRVMAKRYIGQRVQEYAKLMNVSYNRISIREQSTRWGSCSAKGNLNFNWKLLYMPPRVLDYVVVHELAHRFEMNHSERFWAVVARFMPDYQEQRRKLRSYENQINS